MEPKLTIYGDDNIVQYMMSPGMWNVLWDLKEWLRTEEKWNGKDYGAVREQLRDLMEMYDVNLDRIA